MRYYLRGIYRDTGRPFRDHLIDAPDERSARELAADLGMIVEEARLGGSGLYPSAERRILIASVIGVVGLVALGIVLVTRPIDPIVEQSPRIGVRPIAKPPEPEMIPDLTWRAAEMLWPMADGWKWTSDDRDDGEYLLTHQELPRLGISLRGDSLGVSRMMVMGLIDEPLSDFMDVAELLDQMAAIGKQVSGVDGLDNFMNRMLRGPAPNPSSITRGDLTFVVLSEGDSDGVVAVTLRITHAE